MGNSLSAASNSDEEAAPRPGLVLRAKRLLIAPLLLLRRLRRPKEAPESEASEESKPRARNAGREESDEAEQTPAAPPLWRRMLPYGLVLLAGAVAGGGAIYWLSAQVIALQAAELGERQDEIARLKGVLAGYDRMMLQNRKKMDEEQGKRAELENRLSVAQADLTRRPVTREAAGPSAPARPGSSAGRAEAGKSGDCRLQPGSVGSSLKSCLEEFNRP